VIKMGFYDHFSQEEKLPTKYGMDLVRRTNKKILYIFKELIKNEYINILEIGPGRGVFAQLCRDEKINYTAMEVNPILASSLKNEGFEIVMAKVPPIPLASNKFDIVYMNQVFEHMNNPIMAQELIKECYRVLKKGCFLCIISPDYLMWKEEFFNGDYTHNYITTVRRLKEIYYDNDLDIVYVNYFSTTFSGELTTYFLSIISRVLIRSRLIYLLTFGIISEERIYKLRVTLLRSLIIIGKKR